MPIAEGGISGLQCHKIRDQSQTFFLRLRMRFKDRGLARSQHRTKLDQVSEMPCFDVG